MLKGQQTGGHPQSGSESGSEQTCPCRLSRTASCRDVSCPRGLMPMGWMTLCLQGKACWGRGPAHPGCSRSLG